MNENPQTAARLVALLAVLYSVAMSPLKAAAKAVGLTLKNPDNGRKNATTTDQCRESVARLLELWDASLAFRAPILPTLTGFGLKMWQFKVDKKSDTESLLARFALSPRGVGFAGLVNSKGFRPTLRTWAGQTRDWIRASWADKSNRCTATVEERKTDSKGELEDGLRYCCQTCLRWMKNCGDVVADSFGPVCCGKPSLPAYREGEQSGRYEPFAMIYSLVGKAWKMRPFSFATNDGDNGGHIEANPYYGSHLIGDINGGLSWFNKFGSRRIKFKVMAAKMNDVAGNVWRVWVAVPVKVDSVGRWTIDLHVSGMSKADALKMERTHALFANRDGFVDALVGEINRKGRKAYTHKPTAAEATERLALREVK